MDNAISPKLTHLCRMYFPIFINWTSPFPILGLLGGMFHFYSNFKSNFCEQTVENLIRCHILRRLVWFCTVCGCPTKRTLGLYGLKVLHNMFNNEMNGIQAHLNLNKVVDSEDMLCLQQVLFLTFFFLSCLSFPPPPLSL